MPVRVNIPIHIRVDPPALTERRSDIEEAFIAAVGRALSNSLDVVWEQRGGYVDLNVHLPAFTWVGEGLSEVSDETRVSLMEQLSTLLSELIQSSEIYQWQQKAEKVETPLTETPSERIDPQRIHRLLRRYQIPSYEGEGEDTVVEIEGDENEGGYLPFPEWSEYSLSEILDDRDLRSFLYWEAVDRFGASTEGEWFGLLWSTGEGLAIYFVSRQNPEQDFHYFTLPLDSLRIYVPQTGAGDSDSPFAATRQLPPPQPTVIRSHGPFQPNQAEEVIRRFMEATIRAELQQNLPKPDYLPQQEYLDTINELVEQEIIERARSLPNTEFALLEIKIGEVSFFVPFPPNQLWEGIVHLLPVAVMVERTIGDEEAEVGTSGSASGAGSGNQETAERGSGDGTSGDSEGDTEDSAPPGGFVHSGEVDEASTESGPLYPVSRYTRSGTQECSPLLGEPSLAELGEDGDRLRTLIEEIAYKLQISPCEYAARFCVNAASAMGSRAATVAEFSLSDRGFTEPVSTETGNLGLLQFVPTASPAIQFMRHIAAITPLLSELANTITRIYARSEHRVKVQGTWGNDPPGWNLHFYMEFTPAIKDSIGFIFIYTCQVLMLQLLRASAQGIQDRLTNIQAYAPLFEQLVLTQLTDVHELERLRDRLEDALPSPGVLHEVGEATYSTWQGAKQGIIDLFSGENPLSSESEETTGDIVRRNNQVIGIRDRHGNLWTMEDLQSAIATRRGTAESIDPLVKQIIHDEEVVRRFQQHPDAIPTELRRLLTEMQRNNEEITREVINSHVYAFRISKIQEDLPNRNIAGTSFALQGIHLQSHEQIAEFFRGDAYYATAINSLFNAELGAESLTSFFEFTGILLLSVLCPPAAFLVGVATAAYQYSEALESEQIYESLLDPDLVISRAEVEAELFAAELGLALSFIPEAGTILRTGSAGVRSLARQGVRRGARVFARYVRRGITRQMVHQLKDGLVVALSRELVQDQVMEQLISKLLIEPTMQQIYQEFARFNPSTEQAAELSAEELELSDEPAGGA